MGAIATILAERIGRWRNARFRAEMRRLLAREATSSLGGGGRDPVLDELEARIWARVDARVTADDAAAPAPPVTALPRPAGKPPLSAHRLLTLTLPAAAAAVLVFALTSAPKAKTPAPDAGVKGGGETAAPVVEALRIAVVDAHGKIQRGAPGMSVRIGDALVFEAEIRGLDPAHGLPVDLSYAVDGGPDEVVVRDFALKSDREPLATASGYVAFRPSRPGDYTFRLRAAREPQNARETRVHVEAPR